jgi:hypothetical protein
MSYAELFSHRSMKDIMDYMSSQNIATQAVDGKETNDVGPDFKTTGGGQCVVNGTFVAALTAATTINMSDEAVAIPQTAKEGGLALAGRTFTDDAQCYMLVTTIAAGGDAGTYVRLAGYHIDDVPTLKMPYYPPTELCIGLILFDNNGLGNVHVMGTENLLDADLGYTQLVGPNLLPHIDNWDSN